MSSGGNNSSTNTPNGHRLVFWAAVITALLGFVGVVVAGYLGYLGATASSESKAAPDTRAAPTVAAPTPPPPVTVPTEPVAPAAPAAPVTPDTPAAPTERTTAPAPRTVPSATPSAAAPPAASADVQYLSDLHALQGDNRVKTAELSSGGTKTTYVHSLRTVNPSTEYTFEYVINGDWAFFTATIGIENGARDNSGAVFQIYLDGKTAPELSFTVAQYESREIRIPVSGKSKIKLHTANVKREGYFPTVWGDARFTTG
ncbi:NPCBM/NEW2 domain-containing protein [Kitasatospora sp. NPDC057223]|uniref:NPCBM/NEW2 domain-containing protein n=1 Tax=Kitasatospora sp. NPDC057223 TaxID=3346055 RepID=UPI003639001C